MSRSPIITFEDLARVVQDGFTKQNKNFDEIIRSVSSLNKSISEVKSIIDRIDDKIHKIKTLGISKIERKLQTV